MGHPFFKNKNLFITYFSIWVVISVIQMLVLFKQYSLTIEQSAADSFVYNIFFAIFGLSVWYIVKYLKSTKPGVFYLLINHISAAGIIILIWISVGKNFLEYFFSYSETYLQFSELTLIWRISFGLMMYIIILVIYFAAEYYSALQEKILNEAVLKSSAKEAELKMLKAQINPHFLFNSLNSISSFALTDSQRAHEMIIRLSDYFRYAISNSENQLTNLKNEIENSKRYLEIEQIRFGEKLNIHFKIDENGLNVLIPVMILQPLYENAVKYGVYESLATVEIKTEVIFQRNYVEIIIENDFENIPRIKKGEGMGLKNIRERLNLIYNSEELVQTETIKGKFIVNLKIPNKTF